ncbi:unnamed protein product [Caenorhabditis brenneri]
MIDYTDSIAYVEPREMRRFFGEVTTCFFSYMSCFGYKNNHVFADLPVRNEDYIFHIHPAFKVYKESDSLIRYYGSVLAIGQRDGVISEIQKFKDTQKPKKKYKTLTDFIPFDGGLWTRVMKEIEDGLEEDQEEQNIKLTLNDYNYNFDRYIKAKIRTTAENNFFLELAPHRSKCLDSGELKVHTVIGEREELLDKFKDNNWVKAHKIDSRFESNHFQIRQIETVSAYTSGLPTQS